VMKVIGIAKKYGEYPVCGDEFSENYIEQSRRYLSTS
jgi:hypothetical protein